MRELLEKKSIQGSLILIVLLIWGYNTYKIIGAAAEDESLTISDGNESINVTDWQIPELRKNTYKPDFPDPFEPKIVTKVVKEEIIEPEPSPKAEPPVLTLTGIVEKMALVKNQDNQLFFVSAGDTIEGAIVESVSKDSMMVSFESQKITLIMNN